MQQQAGMRGNQLASHVSFSPNSFGNRKPKRSSLVQPSSPHADDMLHPQDNSLDAIFSRITGQLTPAPTLDPAFDPNAPSHGDEGNTTSPGIFDKWRSALVDSLDHDSGSQSRHEATEQQWPQMNNTDMPGIIAQHMGNEHQLHEFQDNMQSGIAPLHSGGIQGTAEALLPLSRQSSRPVSPTRPGSHWVRVGSPDGHPATMSSEAQSSSPARRDVVDAWQMDGSDRAGKPQTVGWDTHDDSRDPSSPRPFVRRSFSQSSLGGPQTQGGRAPSSRDMQQSPGPTPAAASGLSRPGSAGSISKSRLSKMGSPTPLETLGMIENAAGLPVKGTPGAAEGGGQSSSMAASLEEMLSKVWSLHPVVSCHLQQVPCPGHAIVSNQLLCEPCG